MSLGSKTAVDSHFLVRILFLRGLAVVHGVAFLIALNQNKALIGDDGITPASDILQKAKERGLYRQSQRREQWWKDRAANDGSEKDMKDNEEENKKSSALASYNIIKQVANVFNANTAFQKMREVLWDRTDGSGRPLPTLLWFSPPSYKNLNRYLDRIALYGILTSLSMFLLGAANLPMILSLYICQRSLLSVGGPWYGYGWEPQLAELTFHTLFLVPFLSLNQIPYSTPVPKVTVWAMRWFLFRIMMGAGLIKIKSGDIKWKLKNLSAMDYFYETQPVPNPLSVYFHRMPKLWHKFEILINHFVELVVPWFLLLPSFSWGRKLRIGAGLVQILFQCLIIASGNLSFLNWLTLLPAVFCFDDAFISKIFTPRYAFSASVATYNNSFQNVSVTRTIMNILFATLIMKLSIPVVRNLLSKNQVMNGSFDKLRLVNTYGAFGRVNEERDELIISSSDDVKGPWKEYEFKVKPGDVMRRPRWISPYHYRLDWQMWIASCFGSIERSPWMYKFLLKLLREDKEVLGLLSMGHEVRREDQSNIAGDEVKGGDAAKKTGKPKYIRVQRYRYKFNDSMKKGSAYWVREKIGNFFPKHGICTEKTLEDLING